MRRIGPRGLAASVILVALVAGCGEEQVAGGGGIETNNTVALRVFDDLGAPVASARVVARPSDWIPTEGGRSAPGFELTTDAQGVASGELAEGRWTFEARKGGLAILSTRWIDASTGTANLPLAPMGGLSGRVALLAGESYATVVVAGTDHLVRTDSAGRWSLDSLPSGSLELVVAQHPSRRDTIALPPGANDSVPWTGSPALRALETDGWVLLDDFAARRPAVSVASTGASWYMANDRLTGGNSRFLRVDGQVDSVWERFLVAGDPAGGGSFQARFDIDTETQVIGLGYMQVGISLPEPGQCLDFGPLDTLGITLRGNRSVRMEVRAAIHDSLQDYSSYPGIVLSPDSLEWKTFRIPVDQLVPQETSSHPTIPWSRVAECVLEIRLLARTDQDLDMADFRVHGVPLENFVRPRARKP